MPKREPYRNRIELLQGTLDMLILQALRRAPDHGYGIAQTIRSGTDDVLQVETGSLYPALHRLEKQGWITSEWRTTPKHQRAKYYRLTASGRRQLVREHSRWQTITSAVASLMRAESEGKA